MNIRDLYSWKGKVDRRTFLTWGLLLFFVKFQINKYLLFSKGHRPSPFSLDIVELLPSSNISQLSEPATLTALVALPFLWAGIVLCIRRLRDIGAPLVLALLFFFPFINYLFFLILAALPSASSTDAGVEQPAPFIKRLIPDNPFGSGLFAIGMTSTLGLFLIFVSTEMLENYGWGLFLGIPFIVGFITVMLLSVHRFRSYRECVSYAWSAIVAIGTLLLVVGLEGVVCIIMAAPIAFCISLCGATLAYYLQRELWVVNARSSLLAFGLPVLLFAGITQEGLAPSEYPLISVSTVLDIDAPPDRVWQHVVTFSELPEPTSLLFLSGVAYPIKAEIKGEGVGAIRYCKFSTGPFVEPIEVWDPPVKLKFSVTSNPPPLAEWSPFSKIHPPHLRNFFESEGGQFLLSPTANGGTRIEGTTWYRHKISPSAYWRIFSDLIIHRIHSRVLEHIKNLAEKADPRNNTVKVQTEPSFRS